MNKKDIDRARLHGVTARQAGKPKEANPYAGKAALRHQADAWQGGRNETNRLHTRNK
jgi:ribosome modulation factor